MLVIGLYMPYNVFRRKNNVSQSLHGKYFRFWFWYKLTKEWKNDSLLKDLKKQAGELINDKICIVLNSIFCSLSEGGNFQTLLESF